jgi:hypothetical protein
MYQVVHTHNGHVVSTHRLGHVARAACEREARKLYKWRNAPHGGNRSAMVGVEVREVSA